MEPWHLRRPAAGSHLIPINSNQNRRSKQNRYPNHTHRHSGNHRLAMASEVVVTLCMPHCRAVGARRPPQLAWVEGEGQAKRHVISSRTSSSKISSFVIPHPCLPCQCKLPTILGNFIQVQHNEARIGVCSEYYSMVQE
uniref:Uncharacterized protein n=1 Tax=Aegilops tauschii subsp. strangulata TaxID=200361 RepID=A0A453NID7_AEGTS